MKKHLFVLFALVYVISTANRWPLCCMFIFDIRILITPLVYSSSSYICWSNICQRKVTCDNKKTEHLPMYLLLMSIVPSLWLYLNLTARLIVFLLWTLWVWVYIKLVLILTQLDCYSALDSWVWVDIKLVLILTQLDCYPALDSWVWVDIKLFLILTQLDCYPALKLVLPWKFTSSGNIRTSFISTQSRESKAG
jgi:hypothetical protein